MREQSGGNERGWDGKEWGQEESKFFFILTEWMRENTSGSRKREELSSGGDCEERISWSENWKGGEGGTHSICINLGDKVI